MVLGSEFALSIHRGRLSRGLCERTHCDSQRNRYIEHVRHIISSMDKYVEYDMKSTAQTIEALKEFAP
jgi:hypothetical protein